MYARRIILASGPLSTGGTSVPEIITQNLPRERYGHVYHDVDFDALKGKTVLVIGAGASGFDNAGTALEQGAAQVHMLVRRSKLTRLSMIRWSDWSAFMNGYADLGDDERWRLAAQIQRNSTPPPLRALNRVDKRENFHIHFDAPVTAARVADGKVVLTTPKGDFAGDYLLCATGFSFHLDQSPLFANFHQHVALWRDRFTPTSPGSSKFPTSPYLGRHFEFQEKVPGDAPWLPNIFNFTQSATLSMGPTGRVSGLKFGVRRLMLGVQKSLMREDFEEHVANARLYNDSELDGHPWVEPPAF